MSVLHLWQEGEIQRHAHRSLEQLTKSATLALEEGQAWSSWKVCARATLDRTSLMQAVLVGHKWQVLTTRSVLQGKSYQGCLHSQRLTKECSHNANHADNIEHCFIP